MNYNSTVQVYKAMKIEDADLLATILRAAIRHSQIRAEWMLLTVEEYPLAGN